METHRRGFLRTSTLGAIGALASQGQQPQRILIQPAAGESFKRRLAARELLNGLSRLAVAAEVRLAGPDARPAAGELAIALRIDAGQFRNAEAYAVSAQPGQVLIAAASEQALLYAVFDFLERQGVFFGIDGPSYPLEASGGPALPPPQQPWTASPRFAVRGLLPWPDFLNCITVYNEEDFRAYFEAMLRMRFNTFGMHVYTGARQWAESYLSFEFAGVGHLSFLDTSATNRWGYLPQRTSTFGMGAAQFYDGEVFGSDATRLARDPWEQAEQGRRLLRRAFTYAERLGLRTGIGFEPYSVPDEIVRALPPEVRVADLNARNPRVDPDSRAARDLLETRLGQLLEAYPGVDHVWLWEDEGMNWDSRKTGIPLSVTPFLQAHDFLRRHASKKRLVVAGWGGVARHFADFHKRLPRDVIFSCLSDSLGWDPVHEVFGQLEDRERWPIPWLEDDPGMWFPQLLVHRFESDMNRAQRFGCQGLIGIHWRHRIVDPTAAFQSRFSWDEKLTPAAYYRAYARTQAAGDRAARLAGALTDSDRNLKAISTFAGQVKDGHAVTHGFSGDYSEAFTFWSRSEPEARVIASHQEAAAALRAIAGEAASDTEKERLEYLTRQVEMCVPYFEAWGLAHRLHKLLQGAAKSKKDGRAEEARATILKDGVPLWLELAPRVRRALLDFQRVVATRNDLGQLASMHNKFVRLALVRLRLSMKEYLDELPRETESLFEEVMRPDAGAPPRLFLPTRPTVLGDGEKLRLLIVAPGPAQVTGVALHTRARGAAEWVATPARLLGRRTWQATLGPFAPEALAVEYYVSAAAAGRRLVAPPDAPKQAYAVTVA
ncbi:MAG: hypothetical protein AAB225_13470 [Acidobacteriota bacterium]